MKEDPFLGFEDSKNNLFLQSILMFLDNRHDWGCEDAVMHRYLKVPRPKHEVLTSSGLAEPQNQNFKVKGSRITYTGEAADVVEKVGRFCCPVCMC